MTITTATPRAIHPAILAHVQAAHDSGLTVHVPRAYRATDTSPAGFVYVSHPGYPGVAHIQVPTFPGFEPVHLDAPIKPNRKSGSGVLIDHDGTPEGAARVLWEVVKRGTITERFVSNPRTVPTDSHIPASVELWEMGA